MTHSLLCHFYIKDRTGRPGLRKRGKYNSVKNSDDGDACNALEISPEQASSDIDKEFVDRTERGMCAFTDKGPVRSNNCVYAHGSTDGGTLF